MIPFFRFVLVCYGLRNHHRLSQEFWKVVGSEWPSANATFARFPWRSIIRACVTSLGETICIGYKPPREALTRSRAASPRIRKSEGFLISDRRTFSLYPT